MHSCSCWCCAKDKSRYTTQPYIPCPAGLVYIPLGSPCLKATSKLIQQITQHLLPVVWNWLGWQSHRTIKKPTASRLEEASASHIDLSSWRIPGVDWCLSLGDRSNTEPLFDAPPPTWVRPGEGPDRWCCDQNILFQLKWSQFHCPRCYYAANKHLC